MRQNPSASLRCILRAATGQFYTDLIGTRATGRSDVRPGTIKVADDPNVELGQWLHRHPKPRQLRPIPPEYPHSGTAGTRR
jgi:hypothetical protein